MKDDWPERMAQSFFDKAERACSRIISTSGELAKCLVASTPYVIDGRTFTISTPNGDFPFWLGLNGPRIFFIAYVDQSDGEQARETFKFCFGGAMKVGWDFHYEQIEQGVSMWGTCLTDWEKPLATDGESGAKLTAPGCFWAVDVAMMAQSWVRTCEREGISRHKLDPAPL